MIFILHLVYHIDSFASLVAPLVKNLPAMQETEETRVRSLGQEDSRRIKWLTHSSILDWKTPWTEEPGRLQSMGSQRVRHDSATDPLLIGLGILNRLCIPCESWTIKKAER